MATPGGGMAILPQYQGNYYDLQRQQALAQALMQNALTPQMPQATGSGPYTIVPKYTAGQGLSQLGSALLAARTAQNVGQGMNNLGMQQWAALTGGNPGMGMGASSGGAASPLQSAPAGQQPGINDGSAGAPGVSDQLSQQPQQQAPQQQGMLSPGGPMNPLGMPTQQAAMMYLNAPDKYWEAQAAAYKPADIVSQLRAAGVDPSSPLGHQIAQGMLAKTTAPDYVSGRPGGYMLNKTTGQMEQLPQVPEGFTAVQGQNGWQVMPVQGGLGAMGQSAAAKAGGQAQYQLHEVWDPTANGGQGGYVQQTVANVAGAAGSPAPGGAPAPMRGNNPGAMMPGGKLAQYPDMQSGLQAMDGNLANYGRQGVNTLSGVISKWAPPNENNTGAYIQDVSQRLGIPPNQQIDLSNPAVRQAVGTAIMLHENGPQGVFGSPRAAQSGPMASQPPLGTANAANASQGAPSELMKNSYGTLSAADGNYQASRQALQAMIGLAQNTTPADTASRFLPEDAATRLNPSAAEYEKQYANYVSMQGKALGAGGTDQSRGMVANSVPSWDKPQAAKISGLNTQLQQLDMNHMKTQFLTPIYQQGNEKQYTQQSAAFDQNIKPSMMPILQMSGPQQQAAVQAAIKANPSLRPSFEWAFNNGMLK